MHRRIGPPRSRPLWAWPTPLSAALGLAHPALGRSGLAHPALGRSGLAHPALGRSGLALIGCLLGTVTGQAQDLSHSQKQAVDRQERNLKEAQGKFKTLQDAWVAEMAEITKSAPEGGPDPLIPASFFRGHLAKADDVAARCDAMQADLDKNACPAEHPRVKAITDWSAETRQWLSAWKKELAPRLSESERLADPKNYPDLDADFAQMATLAKAYSVRSFASQPAKIAELAKEFPRAVTWSQEKFKVYRPLLVLTGGKKSPLWSKYEAMANAIKGFQEEAGKFFAETEKEVPELIKKAEEMATKAAADKKPAFFTGGVRQQFDKIDNLLEVCRGLVPATDDRLKALESARKDSRQRVDALAASLQEQIVAETRPPTERYNGADKEVLRAKLIEAWRVAYPRDEVLAVKFHMDAFERRERASWDSGAKAWELDDRSVLAVTVIVKTSDRIATTYPAYVNVDNVSQATTFGVKTKTAEHVSEEMLVENVK